MKIGPVLGGAVVALVIIPVIVAVVSVRLHDPSPLPHPQAGDADSPIACATLAPITRGPVIGVAPQEPLGSNLTTFERATGVHPQIVAQYLQFGVSYNPDLACQVAQHGGELLVQWDPTTVSLQHITNGGWDRYIKRFALDVRAAQVPIVLSFGHEMNGDWYHWGNTFVTPRTFKAAWRHVHHVFAKLRVHNVTWCWDVNVWLPGFTGKSNYGITSARRWWPGARYVDWIGLDAYYEVPGETFRSLFQYCLGALHGISHKPVLIAETGAAEGPFQAQQIRSLFSGLRRNNVIGAVYFNSNLNVRYKWRIEGQPAAIAAFRAGARSLARIRNTRT